MENLAGKKDCDTYIEKELIRCGIEIVKDGRSQSEVSASITGRLGSFTFTRNWCYMMVSDKVPLQIAKELYNNPVGLTDIRVAGHCGCPPPENWANWYDPDGNKLLLKTAEAEFEKFSKEFPNFKDGIKFVDDLMKNGRGFIEAYHIDSELGLYIFVQTLKKYNLDTVEMVHTTSA